MQRFLPLTTAIDSLAERDQTRPDPTFEWSDLHSYKVWVVGDAGELTVAVLAKRLTALLSSDSDADMERKPIAVVTGSDRPKTEDDHGNPYQEWWFQLDSNMVIVRRYFRIG